jgi:hypothetical protein
MQTAVPRPCPSLKLDQILDLQYYSVVVAALLFYDLFLILQDEVCVLFVCIPGPERLEEQRRM